LVTLALERERLLGEQARLAALEQADQLKTALLQAVSHDLATPLTAITILLESLKRSLRTHAEGFQAAAEIAEETGRLQRRIESLLAMARLQAGGFEARREPTPAGDLFRVAREHLRVSAPELEFDVSVAVDCPELDADPALVGEILVNLIENAHRASAPEARIELHARPHPELAGRVLLEVLDRGSGLAAAPARPQTAGTGAAADRGGRRGLGLEIARSFAAANNGSVVLLPRPGGGICARVELPAAVLVDASGR
jgi:two-component system sensor histidine kinase KdpD